MKTILILLDGLGDRSYRELDNRTPLQAASTPNLDHLATLGSNGLFHAASPGQCLPSEMAHFLLFGYAPENFPGRGLLEAVGYDISFDDKDVLVLAHLSGVEWKEEIPVLVRGRNETGGDKKNLGLLYEAISRHEIEGIDFRLIQTRRNDAILIISGDVSPHVTDSDPIIMGSPIAHIHPLDQNPEPQKADRTARSMNLYLSYCNKVLSGHPVNHSRKEQGLSQADFLVTQRAGRRIRQEPFHVKWGMKGMIIASDAIYMGLAQELGLDAVRVNDRDAPGSDLRERIRIAMDDQDHDFIHVHTKMPDKAGHTKNPKYKQDVISDLDQGLDEILEAVRAREDILVVITADHSTPSGSNLLHSGEPVPVTFAGPDIRRDDMTVYDEIQAAKGCMGLIRGPEMMLMILNYSNRSTLIGHQLGTTLRPYQSENYEAFRYKK